MKKCKYLRDEKCVDCGLCELTIKLNGEEAEALLNIMEKLEKEDKRDER